MMVEGGKAGAVTLKQMATDDQWAAADRTGIGVPARAYSWEVPARTHVSPVRNHDQRHLIVFIIDLRRF